MPTQNSLVVATGHPNQPRATPFNDTPTTAPPPHQQVPAEQPYSIFDKRQKALIVFIVSVAATCESPFCPDMEDCTPC